MTYKLNFGKFEGKTYEWLFFHAPWYAEWMWENDVCQQGNKFSNNESVYFSELYGRASSLAGTCNYCKERPVTRMGLTSRDQVGTLGLVDFYCDECEYLGGSRTRYNQPSFFLPYRLPRCAHLMVSDAVKLNYIGSGSLTQKRMEAFFRDDANFKEVKPGLLMSVLAAYALS